MVAWKSQRSRALDLAVSQAEDTQIEVDALRAEVTGLRGQLGELHHELSRRDIELIGALARVTTVTDQLRLQNEEDRAHHDRLDRAIELLTTIIASSVPALGQAPGADGVVENPAPAVSTVIGGSVDPSLLNMTGVNGCVIDLTPSDNRDSALQQPFGRFAPPDGQSRSPVS